MQFFDGTGAPEDNQEILKEAKEGDLYMGFFDGMDGKGAGSRLYKRRGDSSWDILLDTVKANQVIVSTTEQVKELFEKFSDRIPAGETVKLNADIDMTGIEAHIESCEGEFDGGGHTITGLSENPLFQDVKGGAYIHDVVIEIENGGSSLSNGSLAKKLTANSEGDVVTVENVTITGNATNVRTAFFDESGSTEGTPGVLNFINCVSDLDVIANNRLSISKVARFINLPNNWEVNFTDCVNKGNLTGLSMSNEVIGGFISYAQGNNTNHITFTRCRNEGDITLNGAATSDPDVGGFIGKVQRATHIIFNDCTNLGNVTVNDQGNTISVGGFIGQTVGGSVTFNGANINGAYTGEGQSMVADPEKGAITAENTKATVNAGGFIGLTGAAVTFNLDGGGSCMNAGSVTVTQSESSDALGVHIGGMIGSTSANVTFKDESMTPYFTLGALSATVQNNNTSHIYMGGIVGQVTNGKFTFDGSMVIGFNLSKTLSANGTETKYIGSFVGYVSSKSAGLTEDALGMFNDLTGIYNNKVGHTDGN